ncbi:polysaccharide pyruvyl transferase family protein [Cruoricaptor ignavus]|uniref:Polysaccharide pyruvyl transferase family protein n=1 Tax=Cruoricaptor ignavus TaxID=1118202 RepID=A0A7M1T0U6_9FLAO|nr:polysaccharide pyruvyl transferase family protein [Cruoricaptor ignavus]QOR73381.1 polysaccharide pyruvyl transferase family protein [Cruoricaptor ignavus]
MTLKDRLKLFLKITVKKKDKRLFLLQTPTHINIGDHFISVAEIQFLEENFPEYDLIEINEKSVQDFIQFRKFISKNDIILLHGGGNLGDEYIHHEKLRRDIITLFSKNKIIILPQTIFFSESEKGRKELEESVKIYSLHKDLTICAREKKSFDFAQEYFNNKVILVPDIVLQYHPTFKNTGGIDNKPLSVGVLRSDRESVLDDKKRQRIISFLEQQSKKVVITDMFYEDRTTEIDNASFRQKLIDEKIKLFNSSSLVVTDRLHGMIVSAITGTPCIAITNYNHKIKESYNWIADSTNTVFIDNIEEIENAFKNLNQLIAEKGNHRTPQKNLEKKFEVLIKEIK